MKSILLLPVFLCALTPVLAQYETNSPEAAMTIEGLSSDGLSPAVAAVPTSRIATLEFGSNQIGLPYDIVFNAAAQVPNGGTVGQQTVNIDLLGGIFSLSGGNFLNVPGAPLGGLAFSVAFGIPTTVPGTLSLQGFALAPALPGALALSSAVTLDVFQDNNLGPSVLSQNPNATIITLADDSFSQQNLTAPFTFYGVNYTSCFVNDNGNITFGAGDPNFVFDPFELEVGAPRIAPWWADLDPTLGGTISFFDTGTGFEVAFTGISEFTVTNTNSFICVVTNGIVTFDYPQVDAADALVGLSPGNSLTVGQAVNWSLGTTGPLNPLEAYYEVFNFVTNAADLSGTQLNIVLDATGGPILNF